MIPGACRITGYQNTLAGYTDLPHRRNYEVNENGWGRKVSMLAHQWDADKSMQGIIGNLVLDIAS